MQLVLSQNDLQESQEAAPLFFCNSLKLWIRAHNSTQHAISIRAPARGATHRIRIFYGDAEFQFAPPRGGRPVHIAGKHGKIDFNSRPREGGDQASPERPFRELYFNSRPREGGDQYTAKGVGQQIISIRAPARGAT